MDIRRRDALAQLAARNRADAHALRTQAVANLVRRVVELEMLQDGNLPVGDFTVTIGCHFEVRDTASAGLMSNTLSDKLAGIAARCKLVLHCADSAGDDIVLVRGKGHLDNSEP